MVESVRIIMLTWEDKEEFTWACKRIAKSTAQANKAFLLLHHSLAVVPV